MVLFTNLRFNRYIGITIFPFVIINKKYKGNEILLNHELIHLKQQLELLVIPFFIWYLMEFLIKLAIYKNWNLAYLNISFEKEAYQNEKDFNYLKNRKLYGFLNYFFREQVY